MDDSSGTKRRNGWTSKTWLGIAVGIAVVAGLIVLAANASGGSGGLY